MTDERKICQKCKIDKSIVDFYKNQKICKICKSLDDKRYRLANKEKVRERKMRYRLANKDKVREQHRNYYLKNKEHALIQNKEYRAANKDKIKARDKEYNARNKSEISLQRKAYRVKNQSKLKEANNRYYQNNKAIISVKTKQYALKNKDKIRQTKRIYKLKNRDHFNRCEVLRRKNNLSVKILHNLRARTHKVLSGINKSKSTLVLLGCTFEEFRIYLEKLFTVGMSWENYGMGLGKWNIDHIVPCSIFDLESAVEQKQCFHFSNHQPLWAPDNLEKYNRTIGLNLLYNDPTPFIL